MPQGMGEQSYQRSGAGDGLEEHLAGLRGGGRWAIGAESPGKESPRRRDGAEGVGGVHTTQGGGRRASVWRPRRRVGIRGNAGGEPRECSWGGMARWGLPDARMGNSKIETGSGVGRPEAEAELMSVECLGQRNGPRIVHTTPPRTSVSVDGSVGLLVVALGCVWSGDGIYFIVTC